MPVFFSHAGMKDLMASAEGLSIRRRLSVLLFGSGAGHPATAPPDLARLVPLAAATATTATTMLAKTRLRFLKACCTGPPLLGWGGERDDTRPKFVRQHSLRMYSAVRSRAIRGLTRPRRRPRRRSSPYRSRWDRTTRPARRRRAPGGYARTACGRFPARLRETGSR